MTVFERKVKYLLTTLLSLFSLDSELLETLGVRCYPGPVRIPLYAQKQLVYDQVQPIPGMTVSRVVDVPDELQKLMAIVLQVEDGAAFRRFGS
jgi:hypothetical protein